MKKIRQGFTLIELMIVLAIAGLIISLVFVAASAAQRNGRDTTRRADTQKLATAIEQWAANNNGALPKSDADILSLKTNSYLDSAKFKDPSKGEDYIVLVQTNSLDPNFCFTKYMAYVPDSLTNPTKYSLETCLESGIYKYTP